MSIDSKRLIEYVIELGSSSDVSDDARYKIYKLLVPFIHKPDDLDLRTICTLEALLGKELLIIPTKQQWRKIKLEHLNDICNENKEKL